MFMKPTPFVGHHDLRFWFSLAVVLVASAGVPILFVGGYLAAALTVALCAAQLACAPYALFPGPRRARRP